MPHGCRSELIFFFFYLFRCKGLREKWGLIKNCKLLEITECILIKNMYFCAYLITECLAMSYSSVFCCGIKNRLTYNGLGILIICRSLIFSGHLLQPEGGHKLPVIGILLLTYDTWLDRATSDFWICLFVIKKFLYQFQGTYGIAKKNNQQDIMDTLEISSLVIHCDASVLTVVVCYRDFSSSLGSCITAFQISSNIICFPAWFGALLHCLLGKLRYRWTIIKSDVVVIANL